MKKQQTYYLLVVFFVFVTCILTSCDVSKDSLVVPTSENQRVGDLSTILPLPEKWVGDLDKMSQRRLVRILVPYNKTLYFLDRGQARGIVHDAGRELEKHLKSKYGSKIAPVRVLFIPTSREHLLQDLIDGHGDIAAGNLTITQARKELVDFAQTGPGKVNEIVVTGPGAPKIKSLEDLADIPIYVRKSSSYYEHLTSLSKEGAITFDIRPADEALEDEDLLEMVNADLLPLAIVDDHKAKFWSQIFENIELREDLVINRGGKIGWAIRKNSPKLKAELNNFLKSKGQRQGVANILLKRYLGSTKYVLNAIDDDDLAKFDKLTKLFRDAAEMYDLDYHLLLAQGYQESRLDQSVRSRAGAVGIMQILPTTAASKAVKIDDIESDPEKNIHAGAKYMRHLLDTYLDDQRIDEWNKLLLGLAAYNAGPGNLRKMRLKAEEMGLDPTVWFNNVEHASAVTIGRENVQYVSNIYKYYIIYRLIEERRSVHAKRLSLATD